MEEEAPPVENDAAEQGSYQVHGQCWSRQNLRFFEWQCHGVPVECHLSQETEEASRDCLPQCQLESGWSEVVRKAHEQRDPTSIRSDKLVLFISKREH